MTTINQIYEFAEDATSANILSNAAYSADAGRLAGHVPGLARQELENAVLRNLSRFNGGLAQFIAGRYEPGVVDDGDRAKIVTGMEAAINALISAFIAAVTTPAQFDNDTSLATTAFVQRALGNLQAQKAVTGAATLTAADAGKHVKCSGTTYQVDLPAASTCTSGSRIKLTNGGTGTVAVARAGADSIYAPTLAVLTSVALLSGDTLDLSSDGVGWYVIGGSTALKYASGAFGSGSGYQRLPGGTIIQWAYGNTSASAGVIVTFPTAFTSWGRANFTLGSATVPSIATTESSGTPLTSVMVHGWDKAGTRVAVPYVMIAVGV